MLLYNNFLENYKLINNSYVYIQLYYLLFSNFLYLYYKDRILMELFKSNFNIQNKIIKN